MVDGAADALVAVPDLTLCRVAVAVGAGSFGMGGLEKADTRCWELTFERVEGSDVCTLRRDMRAAGDEFDELERAVADRDLGGQEAGAPADCRGRDAGDGSSRDAG